MSRDKVINAAYELYGAAAATLQDADPPPEVDPDTGELIEGQLDLQFTEDAESAEK